MRGWNGMSENGILANIFRMGDQVKRNLRDFAGNPGDYLDNVAHQNNIEWKKDPVERSMGFFNPVPLGSISTFLLRKQMKEAIKEITSRPKIPPLPQEVFEQAYRDFPEVPRELMERYLKQAYKTGVAEKTSDPNTWSAAQRTMYDNGDWKGFSKSRGYSDEEIADFNEMLSIHKQMGEYLPEKKGPNGEVWDDLGSIDAFLVNPHVEKTKELLSSFEKNPIQSTSRRDFMKKTAGLAAGSTVGAGVTAKLLRKFAPEERTLAKEANVAKQAAVEAAPKYKYNSLKEYIDDVETNIYSKYEEPWFDEVNDLTARQQVQQRLLQDEQWYTKSKQELSKTPKDSPMYDVVESHTNMFSPQAKKEMKELKTLSQDLHVEYGGNPAETPWVDWLANHPEDPGRVLESLRGYKKMSLDSIPF